MKLFRQECSPGVAEINSLILSDSLNTSIPPGTAPGKLVSIYRPDTTAIECSLFTSELNQFIFNYMVKYYEESLDRIFFALADNKRRQILLELKQGYKTATELAEPFAISLPAITKHLKILESASLLKREIRGRHHYFCLQHESFRSATEWIEYFEEFWQGSFEKLDSFLQTPDH